MFIHAELLNLFYLNTLFNELCLPSDNAEFSVILTLFLRISLYAKHIRRVSKFSLRTSPRTLSDRMNKGGRKTRYNLRQNFQALSSSSGKKKVKHSAKDKQCACSPEYFDLITGICSCPCHVQDNTALSSHQCVSPKILEQDPTSHFATQAGQASPSTSQLAAQAEQKSSTGHFVLQAGQPSPLTSQFATQAGHPSPSTSPFATQAGQPSPFTSQFATQAGPPSPPASPLISVSTSHK